MALLKTVCQNGNSDRVTNVGRIYMDVLWGRCFFPPQSEQKSPGAQQEMPTYWTTSLIAKETHNQLCFFLNDCDNEEVLCENNGNDILNMQITFIKYFG